MKELPQTFIEFLKLIGSPVFIGVAVSLLIKESLWFYKQTPSRKVKIVFAICMGFPIVSNLCLLYLSAAAIVFIEAWWPVLMVGVGAFIASQIWHSYTKNKVRQEPLLIENGASNKTGAMEKKPDPANGLNMPA